MDIAVALVTLTFMEIVLGIDNIIFIAILVAKLPEAKQSKARNTGIILALLLRLGLLFSISWVMTLTDPFISIFDHPFSGRDIILLSGGLFLISKSTFEIHEKVEGVSIAEEKSLGSKAHTLAGIIFQICILDIVFSLDSVITAVGMAKEVWIMVVAMVIAMLVMLVSANSISKFVEKNPTIKILALAFLILIGVMLTMEGMGSHVNKGYIYFAMFFSLGVELLNMRFRKKRKKIKG